jgi:alpha-L-rhamnosidase
LEGLKHAEGKTETIRGTVSSKWKIEAGEFILNVEIPFNTSAFVYIPVDENQTLFESGNLLDGAEGIEYLGYADGAHKLKVKSGNYSFSAHLK